MNEPVRILSDIHLGHRVSRVTRVESLRPLIAGAGTVIFNGDTWQELARAYVDQSRAMLDELKWMCAEEGATAIFLSGNHDPGWPGPGWIELAEGKIVITHGDALLFGGSPWKREILTGEERLRELWDLFPAASHDAEERLRLAREIARELRTKEYPKGKRLFQRIWDAVTPPQRAIRMLDAWLGQGREGDRFCSRYFPKAEILVIGHFHFRGCWSVGKRKIINTGSFLPPGAAHWVEWSDGWLSRGVIEEQKSSWIKGQTLDVWRFTEA